MKKATIALLLICVAVYAQQQSTLADPRDGKTYKTVKIGEQVWMAENLNYDAKDSKCYDNKPANCQEYGRLYNWSTAMKACPSGWHLPSGDEWRKLVDIAGGDKAAGAVLKATSGWNENGNSGWNENGNGTNVFGFSALPGGYGYSGYSSGRFNGVGKIGYWWSSSEYNATITYRRHMYYYNENAYWYGSNKSSLFSVRCLQDYEISSDKLTFTNDKNKKEIYVKFQEGKIESKVLTDKRDGKKYKSVKIGEQVWMAENLNYEADGSGCYQNKPVNCQKYGRLYNWSTAMKACPSGWHLPSSDEWRKLVDIAGGDEAAGAVLKAASGWNKNGNGTDVFGFSALPGGYGYRFNGVGGIGYWWSSSEGNATHAFGRSIGSDYEYARSESRNRSYLFSVRCLQDYKIYVKFQEGKIESKVLTDKRDGKTYKTVKIGEQIWMAENLNYNASGSKCYDNDESNCQEYGRLYNWSTAMKVCPSGWHLPSGDEWQKLVDIAGGKDVAGKKLKAASGWNKNGNGTDGFGFSALPGGYGSSDGSFIIVGDGGNWWSASEDNATNAYYRYMGYYYEHAYWNYYDKSYLFSVRCVKD